ncbi:hypothetical protein ACWCOP_00010 [Maricaulaceae bacterium MS644]
MLTLLFTAASLTLSLAASPADAAALADLGEEGAERLARCGVDKARLESLLALDQDAFDQDMDGGWRVVAGQDGCRAAAADLIEVWRDHSANREADFILDWHAGQMRAMAGEPQAAIVLLERAKTDSEAWNHYADATIAFLERDRAALAAARAELAELRPSEEEMAARRQFLEDNPTITMPEGFVEQPQNLSVVDRLLSCFEGSYAGAYGGECDAPARLETPAEACAYIQARIARQRVDPASQVALAVSPDWAASPAPRAELADLIAQEGRARENAPFGFEYDEVFAQAAAAITGEDLDRIAAAWSSPGRIECPGLDTEAEPFNADMAAFQAWSEANMTAPEPGAPDGAATLALSRPVLFDAGSRLIVIEQSSYTPFPLSRPPSALAAVVIYERLDGAWVREASIVLARGG